MEKTKIFDEKIFKRKNAVNEFVHKLANEEKKVVLYGAGNCGLETLTLLAKYKIKVTYLCDDNEDRIGSYLKNVKISKIEDIVVDVNTVIIITSGYNAKMKEKLKKLGYWSYYVEIDFGRYEEDFETWDFFKQHEKELIETYNLLEDEKSRELFLDLVNYRISRDLSYLNGYEENNQYFAKGIVSLGEKEVFLDLGAFDGDSINNFVDFVEGKYEKIIALEPDKKNYAKLLKNTRSLTNIECFNVGAYKKNTTLSFYSSDANNSFLADDGNSTVEVVSIDELLNKEKVTFIKMDIEGAEYDALLGAKDVIKEHSPLLAIVIYHKTRDLFELPLLINKINPNYRYYLRHHSPTVIETVLYAIKK